MYFPLVGVSFSYLHVVLECLIPTLLNFHKAFCFFNYAIGINMIKNLKCLIAVKT